jgi:hypothetical protein
MVKKVEESLSQINEGDAVSVNASKMIQLSAR